MYYGRLGKDGLGAFGLSKVPAIGPITVALTRLDAVPAYYAPTPSLGPWNLEAYRYLRLRIRSVTNANQPFTLGLAGETWDGTTGAANTYIEVDLDLLCATSETDDVEEKDSRNPIEDPGGFPTHTKTEDQYKLGWGVNWADLPFELSGLTSGETYEIDWIRLVRDESAFSVAPPFTRSFEAWTSPSDTTYLYPLAFYDADGRPSDWPYMARIDPSGAGSDQYRQFRLEEAKLFLNYPWGRDCIQLSITDDGFHNFTLPAMTLCGGGFTYNYATAGCTQWRDVNTEVGVTVLPAQMLWDVVEGYPGAGRGLWDGTAYSTLAPQIPLAFGKVLRGIAVGAAFNAGADNVPLEAAQVVMFETATPTNVAGTALTDSIGRFRTQAPGAKGNKNHTTEIQVDPPLSAAKVVQNRERDRTSFRIETEEADEPIGYAVSRTSRHARVYEKSGTLHVGFSNNASFIWSEHDLAITVDSAEIRYARLGQIDKLFLIVSESGTIKLYEIEDEGGTKTLAITVGAGTHGAFAYTGDGRLFTYRLDSGTVYVRAYDAQGNALYAEQTTTLTGLDDSEISTDYSVGAGGQGRIGLLHRVGGSLVFKTANDGINFS